MKGNCLIAALFLTVATASAQDAWRDTTATDSGGRVILKEGSFIKPVTPRDSILVADRLLYGFELDNVPDSTVLAFPQVANPFMQDVLALPMWQVDTVKVQKIKADNSRLLNIRAAISIQPFEEGTYELPPLFVQRIHPDGTVDTLQFDRQTIQVFTMPVDTATYIPHGISLDGIGGNALADGLLGFGIAGYRLDRLAPQPPPECRWPRFPGARAHYGAPQAG